MLKPYFLVWTFFAGAMVLGTGGVFSQSYPTKPIRIVTAGVGGTADFVARFVAQGIAGPLGQPVVVMNYPSGVIPGQTVSKAAPDGYSLLVAGPTLWIGPLLRDDTPYDPVRDFAPITLLVTEPFVVVVHPSLPVKSVKELIALAKARPGELNYSATGTGGGAHLAAELFKAMANVNIVRIAYRSGSMSITDLLGGQSQLTIDGTSGMLPHVRSGRLRALAVASPQRSALVPELPTVAESGLPGYESAGRTVLFAPAKTPEAIIKRVNQETVRLLSMPETKVRLLETGLDVAGSSPEQSSATLKADIARWSKVIKDAGIRIEQ